MDMARSITSRPVSSRSIDRANSLLHQQLPDDDDELMAQRIAAHVKRARIVTSDNIDLGSLFLLNAGLEQYAKETRYTFGEVDPEVVDLEPEALADYRQSIAQPLPPLKTETAWPPRDVRSYRGKRR